jgi:hypothetical protein
MNKKLLIGVGVALCGGLIAIGAAAIAGSDGEGTVTGPQADRAIEAALEATGGGKATAVERDSEDGATWEVEVVKEDGSVVDVRLDEDYKVVVIEGDNETPDDDDQSE